LRISEWWRGLKGATRWGLGVGVSVILLGAAGLIYWAWPQHYIPLFVDLQPHDSATLVAQLETLGAEYRVDKTTGVIAVPEKVRDHLRMQLLERGVPFKSALGFELFDNAGFGATEFSQKINYQRALEGELARTIMALDPIRYARLHLVLPESSLFKRDREQPKASVTVITAPGRSLTSDQIAGIQRLVASAVPGLLAETVSVHDHRGVSLSGAGAGAVGGTDAIESRVRAKETVESYLTAKVYEILAPIYEPTAIAVSIDASLRMDHVTSTREAMIPAEKDSGAHGSKQLDQIDELPGAIERLSIGVMLPGGNGSDVSIDQIRELIASAVGANTARGDRIAVFPVLQPKARNQEQPPVIAADQSNGSAPPAGDLAHAVWVEPSLSIKLVFFGLAVFLVAAVYAALRRRKGQMSRAEREALLGNVREWLQRDLNKPRPASK